MHLRNLILSIFLISASGVCYAGEGLDALSKSINATIGKVNEYLAAIGETENDGFRAEVKKAKAYIESNQAILSSVSKDALEDDHEDAIPTKTFNFVGVKI